MSDIALVVASCHGSIDSTGQGRCAKAPTELHCDKPGSRGTVDVVLEFCEERSCDTLLSMARAA